jgi:hypothetical protein
LIPSISATVWSLSAPRMLTEVAVPTPPLRVTLTPGVWRSRSATTTACRWVIVAVSRTVTAWPTVDAGRASRLAVTRMSLPASATRSRPLVDCAVWAKAGVAAAMHGSRMRQA